MASDFAYPLGSLAGADDPAWYSGAVNLEASPASWRGPSPWRFEGSRAEWDVDVSLCWPWTVATRAARGHVATRRRPEPLA